MAAVAGVRTLPYAWYADSAVLRLEQERIFARSWQYAARLDQVAEPGQLTTAWAGSLPVLLARGRDDELRGFVNVCRHRGHILCDGDARRETIQCPYHAWTYGLDGALRSAPRSDREPGFDTSGLGLARCRSTRGARSSSSTRIPTRRRSPTTSASCPTSSPPTASTWPRSASTRGPSRTSTPATGRSASRTSSSATTARSRTRASRRCSTSRPTPTGSRRAAGWRASSARRRTAGGRANDSAYSDGEVARGQFHLLFPGTVVNVMPGKPNLSIGPVVPRAPDRTYRFLDYFVGPDTDDEWLADYLELDDQVGAEDRVLVENVQRGVASGGLEAGTLLPESEKLIAWFQALVVEELGADG